MEPFFNLQHNKIVMRKDDVFGRFENFCKVSSSNLIAFTSETNIQTGEKGYFIYVFDLNIPWSCFQVAFKNSKVTVLQWDQSGSYLLVGSVGNVSIYAQKNNLIDQWHEIYAVSFQNENIISAKFFFNGIKYKYQPEQVLYSEKYQKSKSQPTVKGFGSSACFGCIIITSTGLIGAFSFDINTSSTTNNNVEPCRFTKNLGQNRCIYTNADISFKNGQFYVAATNNGQKNPMIQCFRVHIEKVDEELIINSKPLPSFFVNENASIKDMIDLKLYKLKWINQEDADSLIISSNHMTGSIVEIWTLKEESTTVHKLFQTNKSESYKTLMWVNQPHNYRHSRKVLDVITTKIQFGPNFYFFIAYQDSSIHCLNRDGLKRVSITNLNFSASALEHQTKIIKMTSKMAALDITFMGNLLFAIDSIGQVACYKINFDHIMMNLVQATNIIEYCMVSGIDSLDSLLMLKTTQPPSIIDAVLDRLTENFYRQTNYITQYYYIKFLTLKINLHRMTISGQNKAHDLICLLKLISISTAFKSLLRPSDLMTTKNGPAENLAMILSDTTANSDVDKVLLNLEPKDFTIEPVVLSSLQQLIQFVADLALNILVKLPEGRTFLNNTNKTTGDLSDFTALNTIRELLVMIRIWGLLRPSCLPVFSRSADNLDILATLFKLLTKLAPRPDQPDEQLIDECCLLPSQVLINQVQLNTPKTSLSSPLLNSLQFPLQLIHFIEYENLEFTPDFHYVEGCLMNHGLIDSIRYLHLNKSGCNGSIRRCVRCGAFSILKSSMKLSTAMKAWENRWDNCNFCSGKWKSEKI
ncbi:hypothetical protein PVAND_003670 [Polypedilum vanderplanki]|uniref:Mediator of RNA polymerase II transcription subunit 16 n=1 Tax=Polypedilum vanderplanki TaxID=319348 RepID=A0A9J6BUR5_POLVA|nr:hypothetical protein PVAND_003670 [Polypedilum vanderplanki]